MFQIAVLLEDALGAFDVHAEFVALAAGRGFGVRFGVHVGIDADGADGLLAERTGNAIDVLDLRFGFEIKCRDAGVDAVGDFLIGFADAGVDDFFRLARRL